MERLQALVRGYQDEALRRVAERAVANVQKARHRLAREMFRVRREELARVLEDQHLPTLRVDRLRADKLFHAAQRPEHVARVLEEQLGVGDELEVRPFPPGARE